MSYEFKKLSEVEFVESIDDTANILVEVDGEIKKTAKANTGGAEILNVQFVFDYTDDSSSCNVTFQDVLNALSAGVPIVATIKIVFSEWDTFYHMYLSGDEANVDPYERLAFTFYTVDGTWAYLYADGRVQCGEPNG